MKRLLRACSPHHQPHRWLAVNCAVLLWSVLLLAEIRIISISNDRDDDERTGVEFEYLVYNFITCLVWLVEVFFNVLDHRECDPGGKGVGEESEKSRQDSRNQIVALYVEVVLAVYFFVDATSAAVHLSQMQTHRQVRGMAFDVGLSVVAYGYMIYRQYVNWKGREREAEDTTDNDDGSGRIDDLVVDEDGEGFGKDATPSPSLCGQAFVVASIACVAAAAGAGVWWTLEFDLNGARQEQQRLLAISEGVVTACGQPGATGEGSRCRRLCDGRMCCFGGEGDSCFEDEEKHCVLYGGCVALAESNARAGPNVDVDAAEGGHLLQIAKGVVAACDGPNAREEGSECRRLCDGKMCCFEGEEEARDLLEARPCVYAEIDLCAVYAGCAALLD